MKFAATTFALVLATALGASTAFAADKTTDKTAAKTTTPAKTPTPAKTLTPQQQKMKDCNVQAGDKKGDERKAFLSTCLKTDGAATDQTAAAAPAAASDSAASAAPVAGPPKRSPQQAAQREKMKTCSTEAGKKHLAGPERKSFMSTCLKGDSTATPAKH